MTKITLSTLTSITLLILISACGQNRSSSQSTTAPVSEVAQPREFRHVLIPDHLTEIADRASFLAPVFWHNFDFSDTGWLDSPELIETNFATYISVIHHTSPTAANASVRAMLTRALMEDETGKMYRHFVELFHRYLLDPNSPFRNEELYIPVVEHIIENDFNDFAILTRAQLDLEMLLNNRVGTIANDFTFTTADGVRGSLHRLNRPFTIIYFHNPGCPACEEASHMMRSSPLINSMLEARRLDVLTIFTDEDLDSWRMHSDHVSPSWINAHDYPRVIRNQQLYALRAIPSFYLLDREKRVLLRDTDVMTIHHYLQQLGEGR